MAAPKILIHPGFHKTGTTFLQAGIFANDALFGRPWGRDLLTGILMTPHDLDFDASAARLELMNRVTTDESRILILSEEGLSGNPFVGARESASYARRLHAVFPEAKILLTVRNQQDLLRSVYTQYLKEGGRRKPAEFFQPRHYAEFPHFDAGGFAFDRLANFYASLFGENGVMVLPQELLQRDEAAFRIKLAELLGLGEVPPFKATIAKAGNISPPIDNAGIFRMGNRFRRGPFNETGSASDGISPSRILRSLAYKLPALGNGEKQRIAAVTDAFAEDFARSNQKLQQFCPVNLAEFGYIGMTRPTS